MENVNFMLTLCSWCNLIFLQKKKNLLTNLLLLNCLTKSWYDQQSHVLTFILWCRKKEKKKEIGNDIIGRTPADPHDCVPRLVSLLKKSDNTVY